MSLAVLGGSTTIKCRQCHKVRGAVDESRFYKTTVLADQSLTFVDVWFCEKHVKKKAWIYGAPNMLLLSAVDVGIASNWATLKHWDPHRDYLRSLMIGTDDALEPMDKEAVDDLLSNVLYALDRDEEDSDAEEPERISKVKKTGVHKGKAGSSLKG